MRNYNSKKLFISIVFFGLGFALYFSYVITKKIVVSPVSKEQIFAEKEAFEKVYRERLWGEGSGIGSNPENALPFLKLLQSLLRDPKYKTIVDLGCGDWRLMETLQIPDNKLYIGYDLVENVIHNNKSKFAKKNIQFILIRELREFESVRGDLLIVKDVLHHWPVRQIQYFLKSILPNFKYALIVNDFREDASNHNIDFAGFRPINLQTEPFHLDQNFKVLLDYPSHGITKRVYFFMNKE
jgi:hypothetical protein